MALAFSLLLPMGVTRSVGDAGKASNEVVEVRADGSYAEVFKHIKTLHGSDAGKASREVVEVHADGSYAEVVHQNPQADDDSVRPSLAQSHTLALQDSADEADDEIGFGRKHLMRSDENSAIHMKERLVPELAPITDALSGGVAIGACKNFKRVNNIGHKHSHEVAVACPAPLKMVGCSCRDKEGENTGACGTKFGVNETCSAFTKLGRNITAYIRCCHMDWAKDFSIVTSGKSEGEEGKGIIAKCAATHTLLGCACLPADAPNNGCKHNIIQDAACMATNSKNHSAGVRAQALCAVLPNSSNWESVTTGDHVVDKSTNLSCSKPYPELQMVSCSCGSSSGECNGGKALAHRCECYGKRCFATARCANIPVPPRDCLWMNWGEWSDCSVTCGNGSMSRVREIAMLAIDGGADCTGPTNQNITCKGDSSASECNTTRPTVAVEEVKSLCWKRLVAMVGGPKKLVGIILLAVVAVGGGGTYYQMSMKNAKEAEQGEEGESMAWSGGEIWGGQSTW